MVPTFIRGREDGRGAMGGGRGYWLGLEILRRLRNRFSISRGEFIARDLSGGDPFRLLVGIILSQNTTEANAFRAYRELERSIGVTPEALAAAGVEAVAGAIRAAGLYRGKARAIVSLARRVLEGLDLDAALREGRAEELLAIPGIGRKTVDVAMAFYGRPVVPVDTHVRRVARRLGLVDSDDYGRVRGALESIFPPHLRLEAHLYLIKLGREVCRARAPRCGECPLRDLCPTAEGFEDLSYPP